MFQQRKIVTMKKTLRPLGGELQQEMLCPFVYEHAIYYFHRSTGFVKKPTFIPCTSVTQESGKRIWKHACILKWSTSFHSYFHRNNPRITKATHIAKSASRTQTRTRRPLLSMKYVPLEKVMRTKWWPATGEQRMFK